MTIDRIRAQVHLNPFRPFTLHMADGREIYVPHPDFVALGPLGRTVIVYRPDESHHIVDLPLVTDLHVSPESGSSGGQAEAGGNP
jgi:hypothetical protein